MEKCDQCLKVTFIPNINPPSGVPLTSTCWLLEPHSSNTCNFLMDHCKQPPSPSTPTSHFFIPSAVGWRFSVSTVNSLFFFSLHSTLSFPFLILFTFLSPACSEVNPKDMSVKNEGNTISPSAVLFKRHLSFYTKSSLTKQTIQLVLFLKNNLCLF